MNATTLLLETIRKIDGAYAPSSIRAYKSDFAEYISYCENRGLEIFPPNPMSLAEFIIHLSEKGVRSATIRRSVAGISTVYRLNRMPDPSKDPEVIIAMKRMHRKLGRAAKQAQAITSDILKELVATTDNSPRGIRDRALLMVAYDTLCRRSELVSLDIEDVKATEKDRKPHTTILLRRSKTDQESTGRWLHLSVQTQIALNQWLAVIQEKEGPLFRGVASSYTLGTRLSAGQVNRIYKYTARNAKLDNDFIKRISGHSCRVGAAQDLVKSGASLPIIMSRGRWSKTDTVMRYVEHVSLLA